MRNHFGSSAFTFRRLYLSIIFIFADFVRDMTSRDIKVEEVKDGELEVIYIKVEEVKDGELEVKDIVVKGNGFNGFNGVYMDLSIPTKLLLGELDLALMPHLNDYMTMTEKAKLLNGMNFWLEPLTYYLGQYNDKVFEFSWSQEENGRVRLNVEDVTFKPNRVSWKTVLRRRDRKNDDSALSSSRLNVASSCSATRRASASSHVEQA
jgi:hypothetical protein